jgi:hypothetical protein
VALHHVSAGDLHLGEALHPAFGERNLLLHRRALECLDAHFVVTDVHQHRLVVVHPRERRSHQWVEVDVRRPPCARASVEHAGFEVEPRVHPRARRERLEAQAVDVRGDDRIRGCDACRDHVRRLVVARPCDLRHDE